MHLPPQRNANSTPRCQRTNDGVRCCHRTRAAAASPAEPRPAPPSPPVAISSSTLVPTASELSPQMLPPSLHSWKPSLPCLRMFSLCKKHGCLSTPNNPLPVFSNGVDGRHSGETRNLSQSTLKDALTRSMEELGSSFDRGFQPALSLLLAPPNVRSGKPADGATWRWRTEKGDPFSI